MEGLASQELSVEHEREGLLLVATLLLAVIHNACLTASSGVYHPWSICIASASLTCWLAVLLLPRTWRPKVDHTKAAGIICGLGLFVQICIVIMSRPADLGVITRKPELIEWQVLLPIVTVLLVFVWARKRRPSVWIGLVLVALAFGAVASAVVQSEEPVIDVFTWQQVAADRLIGGVNPYRPPMPDVYLGRADAVYPPGLVAPSGWVQTGIVYPPSTLFLTLPAYVMGGDVRWAHLGWMSVGVALVLVLKRTRLALGAAALLLFSPVIYRVIIYAWTEPLLVFSLAVVVCASWKYRRLLPLAVGLMISVKQYGIIFLPLTVLLLPRPLHLASLARFYGVAIAVALTVALPFIIWDFNAFVNSTLIYHLKSPFRPDSFGLLAMAGSAGRTSAAGLLAPLSVLALTPLLMLRMPRSEFGFAASVGVLSMAFFLLSKQSFLNYHFFSASALLIGVAAYSEESSAARTARS